MWFHISSFVTSAVPLAFAWPSPAVAPGPGEALAMCGIAATSFCAQLFMSRALQLLSAARVSAMNLMQARRRRTQAGGDADHSFFVTACKWG